MGWPWRRWLDRRQVGSWASSLVLLLVLRPSGSAWAKEGYSGSAFVRGSLSGLGEPCLGALLLQENTRVCPASI